MEIAELFFRFFIFTMSVFTVTSAILYSEIISDWRICWVEYFRKVKNRQVQKLQFLGVCSLCLSFHVANIIQFLYIPLSNFQWYVGFSLSACGITWILCTYVNKMQWIKATNEQQYNHIESIKELHE